MSDAALERTCTFKGCDRPCLNDAWLCAVHWKLWMQHKLRARTNLQLAGPPAGQQGAASSSAPSDEKKA